MERIKPIDETWNICKDMDMDRKQEVHTIDPVCRSDSRILILGSFPSVRSREAGFYYAHPSNRFWKIMAALFCTSLPDIESRRTFLLANRIALWDTIGRCTIKGSSDSSIEDAEPNDISLLIKETDISTIMLNGRKSESIFRKFHPDFNDADVIAMPSTSAANASYSLQDLIDAWSIITSLL